MFQIFKVIFGCLLCASIFSCVEVQKKDVEKNSSMTPIASILNFAGEEVLSEDRLSQLPARKITSRDSNVWLIEADHINFAKDTRLITNGLDVSFRAGTIHFGDRTNLVTLPSDAKASPGIAGRSGGFITITADRIDGWLYVDFRGEDGGIGQSGPPPDESLKGAQGLPGQNGNCYFEHGDLNTPQGIRCGAAGFGRRGENGKPGFKGGSGAGGGDAGKIEIVARDLRNFYYRIESNNPGKGGPGGMGGEGGESGPHGANGGPNAITYEMGILLSQLASTGRSPDPNVLTDSGVWLFAYVGEKEPPAVQGPVGPTGDSGPDGKPGTIEINEISTTANP